MGIDRLGHEGRNRRPGSTEFIIVICGKGSRVLASRESSRDWNKRIGVRPDCFSGIGIFPFVPDQVADGKAAKVVAIDGLTVSLASFEGVK